MRNAGGGTNLTGSAVKPVMDRPFVVSSGLHFNATQQIPSCMVFSLPEPLAGLVFEWFSYTAFHGPSEIDFFLLEGRRLGSKMR